MNDDRYKEEGDSTTQEQSTYPLPHRKIKVLIPLPYQEQSTYPPFLTVTGTFLINTLLPAAVEVWCQVPVVEYK
jgi:hypothetical protein